MIITTDMKLLLLLFTVTVIIILLSYVLIHAIHHLDCTTLTMRYSYAYKSLDLRYISIDSISIYQNSLVQFCKHKNHYHG